MAEPLLYRHCPDPHEARITCVASGPSGARASGDVLGVVAVIPPGHTGQILRLGEGSEIGAVAVSRDGRLVAWGDAAGTLSVHRTDDGSEIWRQTSDDSAKATTALTFHRNGHLLASLGRDGRIRIQDIQSDKRIGTFESFQGPTLQYQPDGEYLLTIDSTGQVNLLDASTRELFSRPGPTGGARVATFTPDGQWIIAAGSSGVAKIDTHYDSVVPDRVLNSERSSGICGLVPSPDGLDVAVITKRSVHVVSVDNLGSGERHQHGAPDPSGAATWDHDGILVAGADGRMYRPGQSLPLGPAVAVAGVGKHRVVSHGHKLAYWVGDRRKRPSQPAVVEPGRNLDEAQPLPPGERIIDVAISRDASLLAVLPEGRPLHVYDNAHRLMFQAGADTVDTPRFDVGGTVVAVQRSDGGLRWFDLSANRTYELSWPTCFCMTGGGSYLALGVPDGHIRLLAPGTGRPASRVDHADKPVAPIAHPKGAVPRCLAFVHRHTDLICLDNNDELWVVDIKPIFEGRPAEWFLIGQAEHADVDRAWGLQDPDRIVLRVLHANRAEFWWLDPHTGNRVQVTRVLPWATLDPQSGGVLEPAVGGAILERDSRGHERRVLRSLPSNAWVSFDKQGIRGKSDKADQWLRDR
ncbi:MAG: hypothetical protein ACON5B_01445 [Myxococcota bacterium]